MAMREMQNFEYAYMVQELQPLAGQRFSKIYDLGERKLRIKIGQIDMIVELGNYLYIASKIPEAIALSNFSQKVRKELGEKKIKSIYQLNNDRIVVFDFDGYSLILEMFAKGNALLLFGEKILACYSNEQWKDRVIKTGQLYKPPSVRPSEKLDVSKNFIISDLLHLPLGLLYVKEALQSCSIDEKQSGVSLSPEELGCLQNKLAAIKKNAKPYVFFENEKPADYGLAPFAKYKNSRQCSNLSEAIEQCTIQPENEKNAALQKLERRLEKQAAALVQLVQQEKEMKEKGDYLFAEYEKINELLNLAKTQKLEKLPEVYPSIKIDKKKKELDLEL